MTLIAISYDHRQNCIDCIADSRLSSGEVVATDFGPKVMPLHVREVNFFDGDKSQNTPRALHTFGFAYAGSMLSAMSTYGWLCGTLNQLLPRVSNDIADDPLNLEAIAVYAADISTQTVLDTASRHAGSAKDTSSNYLFEAYIFGFCPLSQEFRTFHIKPNAPSEALKYQCLELSLKPKASTSHQFHAIGTGAIKLVDLARRSTGLSIFESVAKLIENENLGDVGGGLQIATVFENYFTLTAVRKGPEDDVGLFWLGRDVTGTKVDGHSIFLSAIKFPNDL